MTRAHLSEAAEFAARRVTLLFPQFIRCVLASLFIVPRELPAQMQASRQIGDTTVRGCVDFRATDVPARLDERNTLYVEQQTVSAQSDGRVLVAGEPVFLWHRTGTRQELVEQDSVIGMVITPPSEVWPIISPLRGRALTSMRSVALPDGWWLVTFAEIVPETSPVVTPKVLSLWAGETDGTSWRRVEKLPAVSDSLLMLTHSTSELSYAEGRVLFAMQSRRGDQPRVVLYERGPAGWSATSMYLGNRAYVASAITQSHELLAVVRNDSTEREDVNSLFVYARPRGDSSWANRGRLVRGFRTPVRDPRIDPRVDGVLLTWRVSSEDGRDDDGWSARLDASGGVIGPITRVADQSYLILHAARGNRGVWVGSNGGRPHRELEVVEHDTSAAPTRSSTTITSYGGLLGATLTSHYLVVIASQPGDPPEVPAVMSVIKSYPWRCE